MELYGVALVPLVVGLVEVAKGVGLPSQFAPLVSLLLGVGAGCLLSPTDIPQAVVVGIMLGLSASGLYSGVKAYVEK